MLVSVKARNFQTKEMEKKVGRKKKENTKRNMDVFLFWSRGAQRSIFEVLHFEILSSIKGKIL